MHMYCNFPCFSDSTIMWALLWSSLMASCEMADILAAFFLWGVCPVSPCLVSSISTHSLWKSSRPMSSFFFSSLLCLRLFSSPSWVWPWTPPPRFSLSLWLPWEGYAKEAILPDSVWQTLYYIILILFYKKHTKIVIILQKNA